MTDPIADMLTRIRNAMQADHREVQIKGSKINRAILERMQEEGFLTDVSWHDDGRQGVLVAVLSRDAEGTPVIDGLERLSKPGRRIYVNSKEIPTSRSGYGTVILSTSHGVVTDKKARELGVGGEVLCSVW